MADYDSGLPIRSESDGVDEKVVCKLIDGTLGGTNQMSIDSDKNAHVEMHGNDPAGVDRVVRTSEIGALTPDGVFHATNNTIPANTAIIVHTRQITPGGTHSSIRVTGINSSVNTNVWAQDVAIRDESGNPFSATNPLPTTSVDSEGDEVNDYDNNSGVAIASAASDNHDYTVTALKTLKLSKIWATASGKLKIEVQIETGVGLGVFVTRFVAFNSTANPNIDLAINENIAVAAGVKVRVIRTNKDNQSQDVYSTICGHEI